MPILCEMLCLKIGCLWILRILKLAKFQKEKLKSCLNFHDLKGRESFFEQKHFNFLPSCFFIFFQILQKFGSFITDCCKALFHFLFFYVWKVAWLNEIEFSFLMIIQSNLGQQMFRPKISGAIDHKRSGYVQYVPVI